MYVEEKLAKGRCEAPVPPTVALPDLGEVHTDVVEIGPVRAESFRERVRPVLPGCSVGHPDITAGTLGAVVTYKGKPGHILSNSHVLAASGSATVGDAILQPARDDGGVLPKDRIGSLTAFVPFVFSDEGFPNRVDAAVASVRKTAGPDPAIDREDEAVEAYDRALALGPDDAERRWLEQRRAEVAAGSSHP